jgi:hypothetical protein
MRDHGYLLAALVGLVLVLAGFFLAANGTPESAFVWTGGILLVVGVFGERLTSAEATREGLKITLQEKVAMLEKVVGSASDPIPKLPTIGVTPASEFNHYRIGGSYWSQPALNTIVSAYGSNTRPEFERALESLEAQIAEGTAVVTIPEADTEK